MNNVTPVPSCLADSSEAFTQLSVTPSNISIFSNEGYRKIRRSATIIGLAISMSATSMVLPNHKNSVMAAEVLPNESTSNSHPVPPAIESETDLAQIQLSDEAQLEQLKLARPAIKHEVKEGESLWKLSKEYKISPEKIAISNHLTPKSELFIGQSLKIPSVKTTVGKSDSNVTSSQLSQSTSTKSNQLDNSLENLRQTRQKLQNSLSELPSQKTLPKSEAIAVVTEVTDAIQQSETISPEKVSTEISGVTLGTSLETKKLASVEISDLKSEKGTFSEPVSIAVPFPETNSQEPRLDELTNSQTDSVPLTAPTRKAKEEEDFSAAESVSISEFETTPVEPITAQPVAISPSQETEITNQSQLSEALKPSNNLEPPALPALEDYQPQTQKVPTQKSYQVRVGDTLNSIARRHGISLTELIRANNITNPNLIKVNQQLVVPQTVKAQKLPESPAVIAESSLKSDREVTGVIIASSSPTLIGNISTNQVSQETAQPEQKAIEISIESSTETYTEKLKADIQGLQQQYQPNNSQATPIAVETTQENHSTLIASETTNPEWIKDRQINQSNNRRIASLHPSAIESDTATSDPQTQLVGSAPTSAEQYNESLQVPIGKTVAPSLPPLSVPDDYLPDAPMRFNGYIWPTKGVLTSGYGWRWGRMHKGVDIAAPIGTPIVAAAPGEVISAGWNSGGYGNLVKLKHSDGSITLYAHNSRILVRKGQKVEQGQQIAAMGSTGYSTGPHLHFEVHPNGKSAVNPVAYLPNRKP